MTSSGDVCWLIDSYMLDLSKDRGCGSIAEAVSRLGMNVCVISSEQAPLRNLELPDWSDRCVVVYGSFRFVRQVQRAASPAYCPGAFADIPNLSYAAFGSRHGNLLLNDDFVILPFGEFRRRGLAPWGGRCFLRPSAVTKSFTGMVVTAPDFTVEMNALERLHHVMPEDLVVAARARGIEKETRFVVVDGQVVSGSTYGWNGNDDIGHPMDEASIDLARRVAADPWQADRAYTCDVALVRDGDRLVARLIELNSFSCASLYACDLDAVVRAVSAAALDEWQQGYAAL
ncbi:ATP-grasp domain-containing protein [Agrobacterium rubi]|nr:ATP-grasp domain-containing protein [Agrobacterium rubi]NTF23896.1 ATP-grasp domain-containing protein [Agrobacterium rubi]